jgi:membrane protease YdiL (CAAX protease family)
VESLHLPTLAVFLVTNTVIALLLAAIPKEFVLRGYTQSSFAERFGQVLTIVLTTVFFVLAPPLLFEVQLVVLSFTPGSLLFTSTTGGGDPLEYYIGAALSLARLATPTRSIATSIGAHVAYLAVVRIVLFRNAHSAGWSMTLVPPGAVFLIPLPLVVASSGFHLFGPRNVRARTTPATAAGIAGGPQPSPRQRLRRP